MNASSQSFIFPDLSLNPQKTTLWKLFLFVILCIFLAEISSTILIYYLNPEPFWLSALIDATIMVIIIFPLLYWFPFRRMIIQIEEHQRSERLITNILQSAPIGISIIDRDGLILHENPASQQLWGSPASGRPGFQPAQLGETITNIELIVDRSDGSQKYILNSAIPFFENGIVAGAIIVDQDITEQKLTEQALAKNEALFKTAFEILPVGAWITDETGKIVFGNPAGKQIWAGARYIGVEQFGEYKGWWLTSGKLIEPDEWAVARAVRNGEVSLNEEIEIECFDGSHKIILNSAIPFHDDQGVTLGVFVVNEDITVRKRFELQLDQQNQELRALSLAEHHQRELTESLIQSMLVLNASLGLQDVLNTIFEQIQRAIPHQKANILQVEGDSVRLIHQYGSNGFAGAQITRGKPFHVDSFPIIRNICSDLQPVLMADNSWNTETLIIPGMDRPASYLAAPLVISGRVTGIINLASDQPNAFTRETANRLMAFAVPAAVAVENARLFTAELRARQVAEILNSVSLALTQSLDIETVLNALVENVCELIPCDHSYIVIVENETNLTLRAMHGYDVGQSAKIALGDSFDTWDSPYLREVISTKTSLLIKDTQTYPGWDTLITHGIVRNWLGVPMVANDRVIGVLALAKATPDFFTPEHVRWAEAIVSQGSVAIQNAWLFEQVRAGHERFQSLARRLVEVQESERRYIARELHDEASQMLTALIFGLQRLEQELNHPENLLPRMTDLTELTNRVLEALHRLAMDLRPASLDHLGLSPAVEQLVKDFRERCESSIHFRSNLLSTDNRLPDYIETSLYRIVQEALTNSIRHAQAKNIDVILEIRQAKLVILIEDDGVGFDASKIQDRHHLGLVGMQERAQMLSGNLLIESKPEGGTTIVVEVPYGN